MSTQLRRLTPWRALAAVLVGLILLPVGIGLGVPHLAKTGLSVPSVLGVVCLGAGLGLLIAGGWALVRRAGSWRGAVLVPVLLLATFVAVWTLGQAVAVTHVPRTEVGATTPADRGMEFDEVELETEDGVTLSGWYVPSANGAAVALLHGAGFTRSGVLDQAEVLAGSGYGVLLFDARGHGRSEGRAMDFGWYGDLDTQAAVSFLAEQPDVEAGRIGAVGMSMGGEEAVGAAAADDRISAVVAEGATNRVSADEEWMSEEYGWRGAVQEQIEWLMYHETDVLTPASPPVSLRRAVEAAAPTPVLLIAGGEEPDEAAAGRFIAGGSPDTVDLWVVPGAGHTAGLDTDPEGWEQRVVGFLDEALAGAM